MRRGDLAALAAHYAAAGEPRGEIVLVIAPPRREHADAARPRRAAAQRARARLGEGSGGEIAAVTGQPRREVYQRALELAKDGGDDA